MAFCGSCGAQVADNIKFCPTCGGEIAVAAPVQQTQQPGYQQPGYQQPGYQQPGYQQPGYQQPGYQQPVVPGAPTQADIRDAQDNKTMSIIAYILFFVPLLTGAHKTSPFAKYHTNQGTILFLLGLAYAIVSQILSAIIRTPISVMGISTGVYYTPGWLVTILWLCSLVILALCIVGIYNAATGKMKPLPVIGGFSVVK